MIVSHTLHLWRIQVRESIEISILLGAGHDKWEPLFVLLLLGLFGMALSLAR